MRTIIGIDPGVKGFVAQITDSLVRVSPISSVMELPKQIPAKAIVYVEKVQPRPAQSLRSVVTSCVNYGALKAVLLLGGYKHTWVTPQEWQKGLGLNRRWERPRGLTDEQYSSWKYQKRKKLHRDEAKRLFPALKITLLNADALLIAEYGRKQCLNY